MDVILLFDQYLLIKEQNDIHNMIILRNTRQNENTLAWYDVAINSTMSTCILLDKF